MASKGSELNNQSFVFTEEEEALLHLGLDKNLTGIELKDELTRRAAAFIKSRKAVESAGNQPPEMHGLDF